MAGRASGDRLSSWRGWRRAAAFLELARRGRRRGRVPSRAHAYGQQAGRRRGARRRGGACRWGGGLRWGVPAAGLAPSRRRGARRNARADRAIPRRTAVRRRRRRVGAPLMKVEFIKPFVQAATEVLE